MKLRLIYASFNEHVAVSFFINDENCGSLCMVKNDFQELCSGLKTLYSDFEAKEE
jgi:hypothetical protein